jgi:hypothetical protein
MSPVGAVGVWSRELAKENSSANPFGRVGTDLPERTHQARDRGTRYEVLMRAANSVVSIY